MRCHMDPIRKQLIDKHSFPFHLVYKDRKSPQHELPDHLHEWNEIIFVYSGRGSIFIDQTFYDLQAGDIIIIPTNTIHRVIPEKSNLISSTAIFFSPTFIQHTSIGDPSVYLNIFGESKRTKNYKYTLSPNHLIELEVYIDQLMKEEQSQNEHKQNALQLWLQLILLMIQDRKSTRLNSSHVAISYAVFCLKKKKKTPEYKSPHRSAADHQQSERSDQ